MMAVLIPIILSFSSLVHMHDYLSSQSLSALTLYNSAITVVLCVEAVKNTSTVIPMSRKRRRKGNPVVSDETVMVMSPPRL
jgi:hypothetical protein